MRKIAVLMILSLYLASTVGIGVYHCDCIHSGSIAFFADDNCKCSCNHDNNCSHDYNDDERHNPQFEERHDCKIKYDALNIDTELNAKSKTVKPILISTHIVNSGSPVSEISKENQIDPYGYRIDKTPLSDIYLNCQLKL